ACARHQVAKVICPQIGAGHQETMLRTLGIDPEKEFCTYPYLGNIGTVSLPITAALAEDRDFLKPGDRVAFLGIGSGLNCLMLGIEWWADGRAGCTTARTRGLSRGPPGARRR